MAARFSAAFVPRADATSSWAILTTIRSRASPTFERLQTDCLKLGRDIFPGEALLDQAARGTGHA
jgi:hypothetical protein